MPVATIIRMNLIKEVLHKDLTTDSARKLFRELRGAWIQGRGQERPIDAWFRRFRNRISYKKWQIQRLSTIISPIMSNLINTLADPTPRKMLDRTQGLTKASIKISCTKRLKVAPILKMKKQCQAILLMMELFQTIWIVERVFNMSQILWFRLFKCLSSRIMELDCSIHRVECLKIPKGAIKRAKPRQWLSQNHLREDKQNQNNTNILMTRC